MALAPMLAPLAGGVLQTVFGWRSVFFTLTAAGIGGAGIVFLLLPETLAQRAAEPVSASSMAKSYAIVARSPAYLAYLGLATTCYAGLFAWISGASFVLQDLYGLSALAFGVAFAFGSIGNMVGSTLSARLSHRFGLDGVLGFGGCAVAAGGLAMVTAVAFGLTSAASLVLPIAIYLAGLGMVLPQSIAGAMTPFPERAGAASSLLGCVQQSVAALFGVMVGLLLGKTAWPLAAGVAVAGCATLLLWIATRAVRARAAKH
jgi:MFS transporter, DHA1 family, multidrug resistance protein